jgi:hypothetical protein
MRLRTRLERLEAQQPPSDDRRFWCWTPADQVAWQTAAAEEKARLWRIYERCGGSPTGQALVSRGEDGRWRVAAFPTPFGRAQYCIGATWREIGRDAFVEWVAAECTLEEMAALQRMHESGWNPENLEEEDTERLHGLINRLTKPFSPPLLKPLKR